MPNNIALKKFPHVCCSHVCYSQRHNVTSPRQRCGLRLKWDRWNNQHFFSPLTRSPIPKYPFYMLIETSGSRMDHDEEKLNKFLQYVMEKRLVLDGTVTNEPGKMKVRKNVLMSNFHRRFFWYRFKMFIAKSLHFSWHNMLKLFYLLSIYIHTYIIQSHNWITEEVFYMAKTLCF